MNGLQVVSLPWTFENGDNASFVVVFTAICIPVCGGPLGDLRQHWVGCQHMSQIVRQVNYGPLKSKRYFIAVRENADEPFLEVTERDLIEANYEELNSCVFSSTRSSETIFSGSIKLNLFWDTLLTLKTRYKNFKCDAHNKFFEVNLYQKNPINKHHWWADIARPAEEIDL